MKNVPFRHRVRQAVRQSRAIPCSGETRDATMASFQRKNTELAVRALKELFLLAAPAVQLRATGTGMAWPLAVSLISARQLTHRAFLPIPPLPPLPPAIPNSDAAAGATAPDAPDLALAAFRFCLDFLPIVAFKSSFKQAGRAAK